MRCVAMLRVVIRAEYFNASKLAIVRVFLPTDEGYINSYLLNEKEKLLGEPLREAWGKNSPEEPYKNYRSRVVVIKGSYEALEKLLEAIENKIRKVALENGYEGKLEVEKYIYYSHSL